MGDGRRERKERGGIPPFRRGNLYAIFYGFQIWREEREKSKKGMRRRDRVKEREEGARERKVASFGITRREKREPADSPAATPSHPSLLSSRPPLSPSLSFSLAVENVFQQMRNGQREEKGR
jgi:hypothetical protein